MLFLILLLLLIVGVLWSKRNYFSTCGEIGCFIGGIGVVISLLVMVFSYACVEADIYAFQEDRIAIETKINTGLYTDEFGLLDKNIIDEIRDYNKSIGSGKSLQRNIWIGIYIPNIYDDFESIDYEIIT